MPQPPLPMHTSTPRFSSRTVRVQASALALRHRGFALAIGTTPGRFGAHSFRYTIRHHGDILHQSDGAYGSAESADRAARLFIDDALGAFDAATHSLDAAC